MKGNIRIPHQTLTCIDGSYSLAQLMTLVFTSLSIPKIPQLLLVLTALFSYPHQLLPAFRLYNSNQLWTSVYLSDFFTWLTCTP